MKGKKIFGILSVLFFYALVFLFVVALYVYPEPLDQAWSDTSDPFAQGEISQLVSGTQDIPPCLGAYGTFSILADRGWVSYCWAYELNPPLEELRTLKSRLQWAEVVGFEFWAYSSPDANQYIFSLQGLDYLLSYWEQNGDIVYDELPHDLGKDVRMFYLYWTDDPYYLVIFELNEINLTLNAVHLKLKGVKAPDYIKSYLRAQDFIL